MKLTRLCSHATVAALLPAHATVAVLLPARVDRGILGPDSLADFGSDKDVEGAIAQCRRNFEVNTLGPLRVSSALVSAG